MKMIEDPSTDWKLTRVFPDVSERWLAVRKEMFEKYNRQLGVTEGMRSFSDQWALWGKGRKKVGVTWTITDPKQIVTYAVPGQSYHQYGLAIDSCFKGGDPYLASIPIQEAMALWEQYGRMCRDNGLTWGGDWARPKQDRPHCQMSYGLSIHDIQVLYEEVGIQGIWSKCNQVIQCGGISK